MHRSKTARPTSASRPKVSSRYTSALLHAARAIATRCFSRREVDALLADLGLIALRQRRDVCAASKRTTYDMTLGDPSHAGRAP